MFDGVTFEALLTNATSLWEEMAIGLLVIASVYLGSRGLKIAKRLFAG